MLSACAQATPSLTPQIDLSETTPVTPTTPPLQTPFPTEEIIRGTVSIRHSWDESQLPTLATIIKNFQAYYPNVLFDVLYIPADSLYDRYASDTREGIGPTLLLGPAEWGPSLYQEGLISDLAPDIKSALLQTLNQPALGAARLDQVLVGLPYSISGVILFRNSDVVTIPPDTFDNLVTLAQTSTQGATLGAYLERSFFYAGAHLDGLGGQMIDKNHMPGFNNGKGVEWLQLLKDFEKAGPTNYFTDEDLDRFKLGHVGWIIDGTWNMRALADAIGPAKLVIDPWPTYGDGHLSGYVKAENVYLSAKAAGDDRRAALKFIEYLVSQESQTHLTEIDRIPASLSVKSPDPVYGALVDEAVKALAEGTTYPVNPEMTTYNLNLDLALRNYYSGNLPPEQVLQTAQDAILRDLENATPVPPP